MKKKFYVFVPVFLIFAVIFTMLTPTVALSESIADKVFRLHILANSDSDFDQELKLKVRDKILKETADLYKKCTSVEAAIQVTEDNADFIENTAQSVVAFYGYSYDVKIDVTRDYFDTRFYDDFTLPAGIYNCLRITIGEGKGHNWWCVMYPAVCISGSSDLLGNELTDDEIELVTQNGFVIRFRAVEIYENIKSKFIS